MKILKVCVASSLLLLSVVASNFSAQAAPGDSISLYFSAPFVTGSAVTDGAVTETFNDYANGAAVGTSVACPTSIPGFATVTYPTGACTIGIGSGTSTGSSVPAIGVPYSSFVNKTTNTTFTFENDVKYVGFWWMMGSNGNNVDFLDSTGNVITSFNVNDVITFLGANSLVNNADTRTVTNVGGGTYLTKRYYRGEAAYTGTVANPVFDYNVATYANEPWVYLNLYVSGTISVSKVRFTGNNFEMDNLTVATKEAKPTDDMVLVKNIYTAPAETQVVTWNPTNTSGQDSSTELVPDAGATSNGTGVVTYSVVDAGTSGCTVDPNTGVITYASIGDCVVRASAAEVTELWLPGFKDVTFSFATAPTVPPTWDPGSGKGDKGGTAEDLAETGSSVLLPLMLSVVLLLVGSASFVLSRRMK